ncbi:MAG TPA: sigma-70 family RNA polymerase sigma factor [Planctomycetota bacterium]
MIGTSVERLFLRFRRTGDTRALARVFDRTAAELWRVATHLCRDRHAAEDAVQSAFLAAIEASADWDESRPLLPWLLGLLANRVREQRRQNSRIVDAVRLESQQRESDPVEVAAQREFDRSVSIALAQLDEPHRTTLSRHLLDGLAASEIAGELGVPAGTVRMRLHRGLDQLRQKLSAGATAPAVIPMTLPRDVAAQIRATVVARAGGKVAPGLTGSAKATAVAVPVVVALTAAILFVASWWRTGNAPPEAAGGAEVAQDGGRAGTDPRIEEPSERIAPTSVATEPVSPTGRLRVLVRNQKTRVGVPGIRLLTEEDGTTRWKSGEFLTGADGWGETILVPGTGFVFPPDTSLDAEIHVDADAVEEVVFDVESRATAEVSVVDPSGKPVADAEVFGRLIDASDEWRLVTREKDGVWREPLLDCGQTALRATAPGFGMSWAQVSGARDQQVELVLAAEHGAIVGRVVDARGVATAAVLQVVQGAGHGSVPVQTDASGRFEVGGLPVGEWSLVAVVSPPTEHACGCAEAVVRAGATTEVVVPTAGPAVVELYMRKSDRTPAVGASASVTDMRARGLPRSWFASQARPDESGLCRLRLPAGEWRLHLLLGVHVEERSIVLSAGEQQVIEHVFGDAGTAEIEVADEQGRPRVGWEVRFENKHVWVHTSTNESGIVRAEAVPAPGVPFVVTTPEGDLPVVRGVALAGQRTRVVIGQQQVPSATVRGRVTTIPNQKPTPTRVRLMSALDLAPNGGGVEVQPDAATGTFEFQDVPPGALVLHVREEWQLLARRSVTVAHGAAVDVGDIDARTCTLHLAVLDEQQLPVMDFDAALGSSEQSLVAWRCDRSPSGCTLTVPAGDSHLLVWGQRLAPLVVPLDLAAGSQTARTVQGSVGVAVTFRLPAGWMAGDVSLIREGKPVLRLVAPLTSEWVRGLLPGRYRIEVCQGREVAVADFVVGEANGTVVDVRVK